MKAFTIDHLIRYLLITASLVVSGRVRAEIEGQAASHLPAEVHWQADQTATSEQPSQAEENSVCSGFGMRVVDGWDQVVVLAVHPLGTAARCGIQVGDILQAIGGVPISQKREFIEIAGLLKAGDQVELLIGRPEASVTMLLPFDPAGQSPPDPTGETPFDSTGQPAKASRSFSPTEVSSDLLVRPADGTIQGMREIILRQQQLIDQLREEIAQLRTDSKAMRSRHSRQF
jgi:hypothetical protein